MRSAYPYLIVIVLLIIGIGAFCWWFTPKDPPRQMVAPQYQRPFLYVVPVTGTSAYAVLEEHLSNGWRVAVSTPLGGSDGTNFMALLILERDRPAGEGEEWPTANGKKTPAVTPEAATPGKSTF